MLVRSPPDLVPVPSASDPRPDRALDLATFARELQTVLARGQRGPYLLVGASFAGLLVSASLTLRYPDQVAGLVFLDADLRVSAESWSGGASGGGARGVGRRADVGGSPG